MACARSYSVESFEQAKFWDDLILLSRLLTYIYDQERQGREPTRIPSEPFVTSKLSDTNKTSLRITNGQGRGLSAQERKAVELRAVEATTKTLHEAGFSEIKDVSSTQSFDLLARKGEATWYIEVKGTTSIDAKNFLLTAAELALHKKLKGTTALALVSNIALRRNAQQTTAEGGVVELIYPWDPDDWNFTPTAFRAERRT